MGKLDGKAALISGAARGQGEAEARLFAREGAAVMLADVLDEDGERVANSIADTGGRASYVHLDVADESGWAAAVERTVAEFGGLDVLVNNAGILLVKPIEETTLEEYQRVIQINQVGVFLGMREAIKPMREAGGGCIINTSSTAGLHGNAGLNAYAASKFAVRGMTKVAAHELGQYGIRVNSVHPGPIDTPMIRPPDGGPPGGGLTRRIPIPRAGEAEEVAKLMLFIAADATYSTGAEFVLDGGLTSGTPLQG